MFMKTNELPLKDAIDEFLEVYRLKSKLNEAKLVKSWEKITGKLISRHTKDLFIKRKTLYVKLDSPALKTELSYSKQKIMDMLNKEAGLEVIRKIVFI